MNSVKLIWPADDSIAVVSGQWQRKPNGEVEATYFRNGTDELEAALLAMTAIRRVKVQRAKNQLNEVAHE